jgi:uncharacterized protein YbjT (DUF2867 family)
MSNVLIAGASGPLGLALIEAGHAAGHRMMALVRPGSEKKIDGARAKIADIRTADVVDRSSLEGTMSGIDIVISTVGLSRGVDRTNEEVDYQGNLNLLNEAKKAGVQTFAFCSVLGCEKAPIGVPVIDQKRRFELALIDSGLNYIIYRPSGFMHGMVQFVAMADKGSIFLFGDGSTPFSPIHMDDLAHTMIDHLDRKNFAFDIGGPEDLTYNDFAKMAFEVAGKPVKIKYAPIWMLNLVLLVLRLTNRRKHSGMLFLRHIFTNDNRAPHYGTITLREHLTKDWALKKGKIEAGTW